MFIHYYHINVSFITKTLYDYRLINFKYYKTVKQVRNYIWFVLSPFFNDIFDYDNP